MSDEDWPYDLTRLLETLGNFGLQVGQTPQSGANDAVTDSGKTPKIRRFSRTVQANRKRALDCIVDAATALGYEEIEADIPSAVVTFRARRFHVTAKVSDVRPGFSDITVEFPTVRLRAVGAAAAATVFTPLVLVVGAPLAAGAAGWRVLENRFAKGFLDNVEGVLNGTGIGEDSSRFPGVEKRERGSTNI